MDQLLAIIAGILLWVRSVFSPLPVDTVQVGAAHVLVEVASTDLTRAKGLSGRARLAANQGMLFVFPDKDYHQFWMKDMRFPLDLIWINTDKVVDITREIPPPKPNEELIVYKPAKLVDTVLEVNSDFAFSNDIKIGDSFERLGQSK